MLPDNLPANGQAYAATVGFSREKRLEQILGNRRRNAGAVVGDCDKRVSFGCRDRDGDCGIIDRRYRIKSIPNQIYKDLSHQRDIDGQMHVLWHLELTNRKVEIPRSQFAGKKLNDSFSKIGCRYLGDRKWGQMRETIVRIKEAADATALGMDERDNLEEGGGGGITVGVVGNIGSEGNDGSDIVAHLVGHNLEDSVVIQL